MGQYYRPVIVNLKGEKTVFDRTLNGEYTMAKLMEHSWFLNDMVNAICKKLYKKPHKVFWVGDYAEEEDFHSIEDFELCKDAWAPEEAAKLTMKTPFNLLGCYIINHTKRFIIDCHKYYHNAADKDGWVIHPLPLLTACGNGKGGGDFGEDYIGYKDVGSWSGDVLEVISDWETEQKLVAKNGYKYYLGIFKEER